jgi:hypothetical protein
MSSQPYIFSIPNYYNVCLIKFVNPTRKTTRYPHTNL